jgi:hypothetical protein
MGLQLPSFEQGRTMAPREIWYSTEGQAFEPGGIILDGSSATAANDQSNLPFPYEIRAGWWVGRYTASPKKCRLCTNTAAVGAGATSTALTLRNPYAFLAGDAITVGGVAATINALNYSTGVATLAAGITWANGAVVLGTDGSQLPYGILPEFTKLKNVDNTIAIDKSVKLAIGGQVNYDVLLGDSAAILAYAAANPANGLLKNLMLFSGSVRIWG